MQKNKRVALWAFLCLGFMLLVMGGILLIAGAYFDNTPLLYIGLGASIIGMCFYVALGVFVFIYFKRKKD